MQTKETRELMFEQVRVWQDSGLSQKKFCEQENIPYHVFHYWYKVYRNKDKPVGGSFVKLQVEPVCRVEIICTDGKRLLFHEPVSADYLKALIS